MKKISARWRNLYTKAGFSSFMASLLAILCGLVVGFVVLLVADPANAFWGLLAILTGGLSDMKNLGQVLYAATPIILTGLSVGFANKTGLFNIGASGQFIVGAYVAVLMGVKCTFIPGPLLWLACLLGAMLAGAVWGLVPGFLKAVCNVNEVIACIMMNYIGMYGVNFLIQLTVFDSLKNQSLPVAENANAPKLGMDLIFRSGATASSANAGIFIAVLAGVVIYYLIEKTKFGYELKACGYNRDAARYAGINETRSIVLSMVIAGALSGLGGACLYLAGAGKGIEVLDVGTNSTERFDYPISGYAVGKAVASGDVHLGVLIAWLGLVTFGTLVMWSASFTNPEVSFSRHLLGIGLGIAVAIVMWNIDLSNLGNLIIKKQPDFDPRTYGFGKLSTMLKNLPRFEVQVRETSDPNVKPIYIRDQEAQ